MVDATTGHEMLTFLDAWSGYNQIKMHPDDQEKTAFRFHLPATGEHYVQRTNRPHHGGIHRRHGGEIKASRPKTLNNGRHFQRPRKYEMKLNPSKCTFGVSSGKFLGYMVTQRGIEASTDQIKAILQLESPQKPKDVQRLTGRVAALNRFIARSSYRCRLFYNILRKSQKFEWMEEHEAALNELKRYLSTPPLLSKPEHGEPLSLYLSVTEVAVSVVLVREQKGIQHPVYYVSKSLLPAETRVIRKNGQVVHTPEWLRSEIRTSDKESSPVLADFVSDFSPSLQMQAEKEILTLEEDKGEQMWELNVDGTSNMKGAGVGLVLKSPQGDLLVQAVRCEFKATNNEAEYEALILSLQLALDLKIRHLQVYSDSQLIVNHVNNSYAARDPTMMAYLEIAQALKLRFQTFNIKQIPRDQNVEADALAALGATFKAGTISTVPIVHVLEPAISKAEQDNEGTAGSPQSQEKGVLANTTSQEEAVDWRKP
ncbi:uncharacterized protein LOC141628977 [Silene latifolia]|uniref:uncharacterized protein LOC141628977 n=1 Tax=Silene latifolia TaxID=37657 RepID=UPI003D780946